MYGIGFINDTIGLCAGKYGQIFSTINAAANWNEFKSGTSCNFWGLSFKDKTHAWVVGDSGVILKTASPVILGVDEVTMDENSKMEVYPNPFSSQTTIAFSDNFTRGNLSIYDLSGREMMQFPVSAGMKSFTLNRNELESGIYFCKLSDENGSIIAIKKIIKL
jgi:hypothetical protein